MSAFGSKAGHDQKSRLKILSGRDASVSLFGGRQGRDVALLVDVVDGN